MLKTTATAISERENNGSYVYISVLVNDYDDDEQK
jgi:hypothetical protein